MNGSRKTEARRWFQQAYYDLQACRCNIKGAFFDTACFLAQQAGEKALKSLLYFQGSRKKALLTHSLVEMMREVGKRAASFLDLSEDARRLDLHYIPSRYPNGIPSGYPHQFYSEKTAESAFQSAEAIFDAIRVYLIERGGEEIVRIEENGC